MLLLECLAIFLPDLQRIILAWSGSSGYPEDVMEEAIQMVILYLLERHPDITFPSYNHFCSYVYLAARHRCLEIIREIIPSINSTTQSSSITNENFYRTVIERISNRYGEGPGERCNRLLELMRTDNSAYFDSSNDFNVAYAASSLGMSRYYVEQAFERIQMTFIEIND